MQTRLADRGVELLDPRPGGAQIGKIQSFGKPRVDRRQERMRLLEPPILAQQQSKVVGEL